MAKNKKTVEEFLSYFSNVGMNCHSKPDEENNTFMMDGEFVFNIEETTKFQKGLVPFSCYAYHDGVNLNDSAIEEGTFKEYSKSLEYRPIIGHIVEDEEGHKDFSGHATKTVADEEGNLTIVPDEQIMGVVLPGIEFVEDKTVGVTRAKINGFLFEKYCGDTIDIINNKENKTVDVSVELSVNEATFKDGIIYFDDYCVNGITLLGSGHNPGMAGSKLSLFAKEEPPLRIEETKNNFNQMIEALADKLTEAVTERFEIEKGGTGMKKKTKEAVMEEAVVGEGAEAPVVEETKEEEQVDESVTENVEAAPEKETAEAEETETEEVKEEKASDEEAAEGIYTRTVKFTLSHDSIEEKLYEQLESVMGDDYCSYIVSVYDDTFVCRNGKKRRYERYSYAKNDTNVAINPDPTEVFAEFLTQDEMGLLTTMRGNYEELKNKVAEYETKETRAAKEAVLNDAMYAVYLEEEEFTSLKDKMDELSVEELTSQAELAFAKCVRKVGHFESSFEAKEKPKVHQFSFKNKDEKKSEPYGNFSKY